MKRRVHVHDELQSELILIGATELDLVRHEVAKLKNFIDKTPSANLRDIAYTSGVNAQNELVKVAVVATSTTDLREKLDLVTRRVDSAKSPAFFTKGVYLGTEMCPAPGRTVFLFPGEGSQYPDMMRDLSLHFPACRSAFDDADTACAMTDANYAPSKWIFPPSDIPEKSIAEEMGMATAIQAVIAADTGLLRLFTQIGVTPDAVAGLGIGEVVAMEAAKAINYKTRTERLAALSRGYKLLSAMPAGIDKLIPSALTASVAGLSLERLQRVLRDFEDEALLTRDLGHDLFCVCIKSHAAEAVKSRLAAIGGLIRPLPVAKPFHTPWIKPLIPELVSFFEDILTSTPELPVYSFMTAAPFDGTAPLDWARQAAAQWAHPTRIRDTIERLYADGFRVFVELGARGAISTAVASTLRRRPHLALAANRGHRPDVMQLNHTLAALASHGAFVDIKALHANRSSQILDFSHPGLTHAQRQQKIIQLPTKLPCMRPAKIPEGLIADAKPKSVPARTTRSVIEEIEDCRTDFPLLSDAEIIRFSPETHIDLLKTVSTFEYPVLNDAALSAGSTSVSDKSARGLLVFPIEFCLEMMAEAASKLYPKRVVSAVCNLRLIGWPVIRNQSNIRIQAKRMPKTAVMLEQVDVAISECDPSSSMAPTPIASATIFLSEIYPQPCATTCGALRNPVRLDWDGNDLYPERLPDGERRRNIISVMEWGENGLSAKCVILPRRNLIRSTTAPRFALDPGLFSAIGSLLSVWHAREPADGKIQIAYACERIDIFAPTLPEWTQCQAAISTSQIRHTDSYTVCDAEIIDPDHRVVLKVSAWKNRIIRVRPQLHHLMLHPAEGFFTDEIPRTTMPALPQEVVCCAAEVIKSEYDDPDATIRMKITANLTLSATELMKWNELNVGPVRQTEWLFGRLSAKDAVRRCLLARYGRKWTSADIRIEADEAGKPIPQGSWRRHCGAPMDVSITHTSNRIVAAASPNASLGIDIENRNRVISEEFVAAAFTTLEQEIAAESGDGATALFRFWCAKEALSKALGTGLRYGARDLCARSLDPVSGSIGMEATNLWLQPFPQLRGKIVTVQSCIIEDMILAVCVLEQSMVKNEQGPFIRWPESTKN